MLEFTVQMLFNNTLQLAGDKKSIDGIMQVLQVAQEYRKQAGNIGCDGDLLYDEDAKIECVNVVQAILDILEKHDDHTILSRAAEHE